LNRDQAAAVTGGAPPVAERGRDTRVAQKNSASVGLPMEPGAAATRSAASACNQGNFRYFQAPAVWLFSPAS